jgi:hypothetical protein
MSLRDFWINLRNGVAFLGPPTVLSDSTSVSELATEPVLERATIWLTPKVVQGFDRRDFESPVRLLSEGELDRLEQYVRRFQEVAKQIPRNKPATPQQVEQALEPLKGIVKIMQLARFSDLEAFRIGKSIEQQLAGEFPTWVRNIRYETGRDANGELAVWIWVEIDDSVAERPDFDKQVSQVQEFIRDAMSSEFEHWPYVRIRTTSEEASLRGERGT